MDLLTISFMKIPDTTHARIWAVWSAFDAVGNRVGTLLDFLLGLGQSIGSRRYFGGALTGDWSAVV